MTRGIFFLTTLFIVSNTFAGADRFQSRITKISSRAPLSLINSPTSGVATLSLKDRSLRIDFYDHQKLVSTFEAPLTSATEGVCNIITYQGATEDHNTRVEIALNDNKRFREHCVSYLPVPPMGGSLKVPDQNGKLVTFRISGTQLEP